jgi:hypothetical protein
MRLAVRGDGQLGVGPVMLEMSSQAPLRKSVMTVVSSWRHARGGTLDGAGCAAPRATRAPAGSKTKSSNGLGQVDAVDLQCLCRGRGQRVATAQTGLEDIRDQLRLRLQAPVRAATPGCRGTG